MTDKVYRKSFSGETLPLTDLCLEISDCPHSTPNWTDNGTLVIRNFNIKNGRLDLTDKYYTDENTFKNRTKRSSPSPGDLIITREAPMGEVCVIPENIKCCLGQRMVLIKPNKKICNNRFLLYSLVSKYVQQQIKKSDNSGSIVSNLCIPDLEQLRIPIIPIDSQEKVANILSLIDCKIDTNNKINSELEQIAKTLYDYWFVQFDFPNKNGLPYKTSGGVMEYNDELRRKIPQGWSVNKVGDILETSLGGTPSTLNKEYWENGTINWLSSGEMSNFPIVKADSKITQEAVRNSATKLMQKGTVALSITRYIRPTILGIDSCANQSVVGIHESETYKCSYLYPYFKNEVAQYMVIRTGAMQPHINKETIASSQIIKPENKVLEAYYKLASPYYKLIENKAFEIQELTQLRDFLLPLLMNGQVKIT